MNCAPWIFNMEENLSSALQSLKLREEGPLTHCFENLVGAMTNSNDSEGIAKTLVAGEILVELEFLLSSDRQYRAKAAELVAEIAKTECLRPLCVDASIVPPLIEMLASADMEENIQACRALGNICFDTDPGRDAVYERDGVEKLLHLMRRYNSSREESAEKLCMIMCGCVLNISNTKEIIQKQAVSLGAVELLNGYLQHYPDNEDLCTMDVMALGVLAETDEGRQKIAEVKVSATLVNLLKTEVGKEIDDAIYELLMTISENDEIKTQLAESDLKDLILSTIKNNCDNDDTDSLQLTKLASDLVVLLLNGDNSMDVLYSEGNGLVFKEALSWVRHSNMQLRMSGILAVGNFARNDDQCIKMVTLGVAQDLLTALKESEEQMLAMSIQFAVLSTLKNLAIPASNKKYFSDIKMLETITPLVTSSDVSQVQFKLLGLLRMLIDGQEKGAQFLGSNKDVLARIIKYCDVQGHEGVKGEANRLVAWILKNSGSSEVMKNAVQNGAIPHLVAMVTSEHVLMQNEALVALTLITTVILGDATEVLLSSSLVSTLTAMLSADSTLSQILCNIMTLVDTTCKSESLHEAFESGGIIESLSRLCLHEEKVVQDNAKELMKKFSIK